MKIVSTKVYKSVGILYRTRCILSKFLRKQLYFSFINHYLNYANIAWASTNKSKRKAVYCHKKHAARVINFKDKSPSVKPLLEQIKAMTVYAMNLLQTLCFMYLCKNENRPSIFKHIYWLKPISKYTTRSKNILFKPLCKKNFAKFKLSYHIYGINLLPHKLPTRSCNDTHIQITIKKDYLCTY